MSNADAFVATIDDWVAETRARLDAVARIASQLLFKEVLRPVGDGGRMRVDTGFLRASWTASLNSPNLTLKDKPKDGVFALDVGQINVMIAGMKTGDTIYLMSSSKYARPREYGSRGRAGDGFVQANAARWQDFVDEAVRLVKAGAQSGS